MSDLDEAIKAGMDMGRVEGRVREALAIIKEMKKRVDRAKAAGEVGTAGALAQLAEHIVNRSERHTAQLDVMAGRLDKLAERPAQIEQAVKKGMAN